MASEPSQSTSRLEDSVTSTACDQSPTGESQPMIQTSEAANNDTGFENELKPVLEVGARESDRPFVKKPKLEVASSHRNDDETECMKELKLELETSWSNEVIGEIVKDEGVEGGIGEDGGGGGAKKPRLDAESIRSTDDWNDRGGDRRRNKSTSATVLLGLVKSRVRKLAAERIEAKAVSSDATVPLSSQASASSLSTTSSPRASTPPGE